MLDAMTPIPKQKTSNGENGLTEVPLGGTGVTIGRTSELVFSLVILPKALIEDNCSNLLCYVQRAREKPFKSWLT